MGLRSSKPNCSKCGAIKEGSYIKESWCGKCIGEKRRARVAQKRADLGLPQWGTGRDPKCKICRNVKEDKYMNGSYCAKCKLERLKISYDQKKFAAGKESRRQGRNPICKCGVIKENSNEAFCRNCINEKKRALRSKNKENPNWVIMDRNRNIARFAENAEQKIKQTCRLETLKAIRHGVLIRSSCEVCGVDDDTIQAHHDDYTKPLQVRWLCSWHHAEHHKQK